MSAEQVVTTNNKNKHTMGIDKIQYLKQLMKLYKKCFEEGAFQVAVRVFKIIGEMQGFFQKNNDIKIELKELNDKTIDALIKHLEH